PPYSIFFFQAEDGIRDRNVTGVQTCALPISGMLEGRARVYCHFGREVEFDQHLLAWMRRLRTLRGGGVVPKEFVSLGHLLHDLRSEERRVGKEWRYVS